MDRRRFLATTAMAWAGAQAAPGSPPPDDVPPCVIPASCDQLWTKHPAGASSGMLPDTYPPRPALGLPEVFQPKNDPPRVRRVWSGIDPDKDRDLLCLLKQGYCALSALNQDDPRSLLRQTWLHDYYCSDQLTWGGGVHGSWAFLPWHRIFLYFHEKTLAAVLKKPDFALPAWDWEQTTDIPRFFLDLGLPTFLTGTANRAPDINPGEWVNQSAIQGWLFSNNFSDFAGTSSQCPSAGGTHSNVHTFLVGGAMRIPRTAAGDPVFFAHHGNVDRFWDYWQRTKKFPIPDGFGDQTFLMFDENGHQIQVRAKDFLSLDALGYSYERPDPPIPACDFVPLTFEQQLLSAAEVLKVKALSLGAEFLQKPQATIFDIGKSLAEFDYRRLDYRSLLDPSCMKSFPVRITTELPNGVEAGKGYVVSLEFPGDPAHPAPYPIAGLGVFSSPGHMDMPYEVLIAGSITPELLQVLVNSRGKFRVVISDRTDNLKRMEISSPLLEILTPRQYFDKGMEWLKKLGLAGG